VLGKHTLKPGEKTQLKVTFATANAPGPFEKIVSIDIEAPEQKQYEVIMTGTVKEAPGAKIAMTSRKVDIGVVKQGEAKKQKISVKNIGELPLTISKISVKGGASIAVSVEAIPVTIKGGQAADVELAITPAKSGAFSERVTVESNAKNAPKTGFVIQVTGKAE
jgi:uncharacterized membrane protein